MASKIEINIHWVPANQRLISKTETNPARIKAKTESKKDSFAGPSLFSFPIKHLPSNIIIAQSLFNNE